MLKECVDGLSLFEINHLMRDSPHHGKSKAVQPFFQVPGFSMFVSDVQFDTVARNENWHDDLLFVSGAHHGCQ